MSLAKKLTKKAIQRGGTGEVIERVVKLNISQIKTLIKSENLITSYEQIKKLTNLNNFKQKAKYSDTVRLDKIEYYETLFKLLNEQSDDVVKALKNVRYDAENKLTSKIPLRVQILQNKIHGYTNFLQKLFDKTEIIKNKKNAETIRNAFDNHNEQKNDGIIDHLIQQMFEKPEDDGIIEQLIKEMELDTSEVIDELAYTTVSNIYNSNDTSIMFRHLIDYYSNVDDVFMETDVFEYYDNFFGTLGPKLNKTKVEVEKIKRYAEFLLKLFANSSIIKNKENAKTIYNAFTSEEESKNDKMIIDELINKILGIDGITDDDSIDKDVDKTVYDLVNETEAYTRYWSDDLSYSTDSDYPSSLSGLSRSRQNSQSLSGYSTPRSSQGSLRTELSLSSLPKDGKKDGDTETDLEEFPTVRRMSAPVVYRNDIDKIGTIRKKVRKIDRAIDENTNTLREMNGLGERGIRGMLNTYHETKRRGGKMTVLERIDEVAKKGTKNTGKSAVKSTKTTSKTTSKTTRRR